MSPIEDVLNFARMTHELQKVKRAMWVPGEDRLENDSEHHYQVAMIAWYIATSQKLDLDLNKVLQYALIHDMVEAYAGDVDVFASDRSAKAKNEQLAAEKLKRNFPLFIELYPLIQNYEKRADPESRFVYAVDKIIPTLNNYLDDGRTWKLRGITLDMVSNSKAGKVSQHPAVENLWKEFYHKIKAEESRLFPSDSIPLTDPRFVKKQKSAE